MFFILFFYFFLVFYFIPLNPLIPTLVAISPSFSFYIITKKYFFYFFYIWFSKLDVMVSFSSYPGMMFFAAGFEYFGIVLKPSSLKNTKKI